MKYENMDMEKLESAARTILNEFVKAGLKAVYHHWCGKYGEDVDYNWDLIWDPDGLLTTDTLGVREWKFVPAEANLKKYNFEEEGVTNVYLLSERDKEFVLGLLNSMTYTIDRRDHRRETKPQRAVVQFLNVALDLGLIPSGPDLTHPAADEWYQNEELVDLVISGKALIRDDIIARAAGLDPEQRKNVQEIYHISVPSHTPVMHIFFDSVSGKMRKERIYLNDIELVEDSYDQDVYLDNVVLGDYEDNDVETMASLLKDGEA